MRRTLRGVVQNGDIIAIVGIFSQVASLVMFQDCPPGFPWVQDFLPFFIIYMKFRCRPAWIVLQENSGFPSMSIVRFERFWKFWDSFLV